MKRVTGPLWLGLAVFLVLAPSAYASPLDHMFCYKMKDTGGFATPPKVDLLAELQPEFSQKGCVLLKPVEFCVPVTKANVNPPPTNPNIVGQPLRGDYICYLAKCDRQVLPPARTVVDQFGQHLQQNYRPLTVCVPAEKVPLECGAIAGTKRCGGACPDPTQQCRLDSQTRQCTCTPQACEGLPDRGGVCGGTCPPGEVCRPSTATTRAPRCECQPPITPLCGLRPDGVCGGACPNAAEKCVLDANGKCTCQNVEPPCRNTGTAASGPVCGGFCPPGQACDLVSGTNVCKCQPPLQCGPDLLTGACGGDCPAGEECLRDSTAAECKCQAPPCGSDPQGNCGGVCPTGLACVQDASGACNCEGVVPRD